jgi:DNA repair protein SbcC/Rad50
MHAFLRRFLAPRWQHPDAEVRYQAVSRLDPARPEQRQALETLCLDSAPSVRQAALERIVSPDTLIGLLEQAPDSPEIQHRLTTLLAGSEGGIDLAQRLHVVERLDDRKLLARIALEGDNQQLRLAAVARLKEEDDLITQACDNGIAAVRHAAAARVTSEAGLQRLAQQARRDRQVMRHARERLNRLRHDAATLAAAHQQRETLLSKLEAHARAPWEPLYGGRYRHLAREWEALGDLPDAEQERRFQEASLGCRKVISDHEAHEHAIAESDRRREQAAEARESLLEALEDSLASLPRGDRLTGQDIASLRSQKVLLANRWQALSDLHVTDEALRERYDAVLADYDSILHTWERYERHAGEIEQALKAEDTERLAAAVEACQWPRQLPPTPLLSRAQSLLAGQQQPAEGDLEARIERFGQDLDQLEKLLDRGVFKGASRLHQSLRHRAETLPSASLRPHQARLKRLGARLAELRDWRGFVAGPKREQLCKAIAQLADTREITEAELDRRHRQLVRDWKGLGDAAASRELSDHFRSNSDRIHERLAPWRERQATERTRNLEARTALCDQLEALLDSPATNADPDALRRIRDQAREEWRRHSPVPREQAQIIARRFGRIRFALQGLIDQRAKEVADAKQGLIDEARKLLEESLPPAVRADKAKSLQQRWRELGRAPRGEEQTLWREFRALCDQIFALREAQRDDRAQQARERLDAMQALIDRLDAWQPARSGDSPVLESAIEQASALEPLPPGRRAEGMRRRWSGIVRTRRERLSRLAMLEEVQRWQACRPLLDAHLAADAACLEQGRCEDVPLDSALDLSQAIRKAHEQRNHARRHPAPRETVSERLARLRVHLSLLAMGRISQHDEPLRLAIQVERLNEGLGRELSRAEELRIVLCNLLATGPVSPEQWEREAGELDALLTRLTRLPPP